MDYYTPALFDFLRRLAANNNREWFAAHKEEYDRLRGLWLDDLQHLIDCMSEWEPRLKGRTAKESAYRIYRDTRFSLDKTPYKVFFSASINPYLKNAHRPGYYLQMDIRPGETGLYGGIWRPEAPLLRKLRKAIVDNIEEWEEITDNKAVNRYFPGWISSETLKTAPKGWDKDHPQIELLRLKDYGKFCPLDEKFFHDPHWPENAAERFRVLQPFIQFLNYSIEEE